MAKITIRQIRSKLFKIVSKIFDEYFTETYTRLAPQFQNNLPEVLDFFDDSCNDYIIKLSSILDSKEEISVLNKSVEDPVIFCFFYRYHVITTYLVSLNQSESRLFPVSEDLFFKKIFLDLFRVEILGLST